MNPEEDDDDSGPSLLLPKRVKAPSRDIWVDLTAPEPPSEGGVLPLPPTPAPEAEIVNIPSTAPDAAAVPKRLELP